MERERERQKQRQRQRDRETESVSDCLAKEYSTTDLFIDAAMTTHHREKRSYKKKRIPSAFPGLSLQRVLAWSFGLSFMRPLSHFLLLTPHYSSSEDDDDHYNYFTAASTKSGRDKKKKTRDTNEHWVSNAMHSNKV